MVVVDDLPIMDPGGDTFDVADDFQPPAGGKYYSDIQEPGSSKRREKVRPERRVRHRG